MSEDEHASLLRKMRKQNETIPLTFNGEKVGAIHITEDGQYGDIVYDSETSAKIRDLKTSLADIGYSLDVAPGDREGELLKERLRKYSEG